jgi:hypothetical protein
MERGARRRRTATRRPPRGDDPDAAAPGPAARRARGSQFERAHEFVEHGAAFELGERGGDAAANAAAEGQPRARGWGREQEGVHLPLRRMRVDVGRRCTSGLHEATVAPAGSCHPAIVFGPRSRLRFPSGTGG